MVGRRSPQLLRRGVAARPLLRRPARLRSGDETTLWDASTSNVPPTFDGPAVLADDDALLEWLCALRSFGLTRLRDVPVDLDEVGRVAGRVGIVRETNFGVLWDVRSEPDPITNANTALSLPPHVDLATASTNPACSSCTASRTRRTAGRAPTSTGSASLRSCVTSNPSTSRCSPPCRGLGQPLQGQ